MDGFVPVVVQSVVAPHFPAETTWKKRAKTRDPRVPIGILSVRYSPCKLLSKTFVVDVDASNNGERGVSTSVFHGLDERVSQYPELELQQTGRAGVVITNATAWRVSSPNHGFSLTGTLKSWGKRQPPSWKRKNNTDDHEYTHPRSFARRNSLISAKSADCPLFPSTLQSRHWSLS